MTETVTVSMLDVPWQLWNWNDLSYIQKHFKFAAEYSGSRPGLCKTVTALSEKCKLVGLFCVGHWCP